MPKLRAAKENNPTKKPTSRGIGNIKSSAFPLQVVNAREGIRTVDASPLECVVNLPLLERRHFCRPKKDLDHYQTGRPGQMNHPTQQPLFHGLIRRYARI